MSRNYSGDRIRRELLPVLPEIRRCKPIVLQADSKKREKAMNHVRFGKTDLSVSRLGLGCHSFGTRHRARGWDPFTREGRRQVQRTVHAALEAGVNFFDTSPDYGNGHSEALLGEALADRRSDVVLATKVPYHRGTTPEHIESSVTASADRLRTDYIDIVQFHGGNYPPPVTRRIMEGGLLDALLRLRDRGLIGHCGFTVADPVTAKDMTHHGAFAMVQMLYHLIEQAGARHALDWSQEQDLGITVMRPLTAGTFQQIVAALAPSWSKAHDPNEICLKFLLSDSRVHVVNVGMRWDAEVLKNAELVSSFEPSFDVAQLTRSVGQLAREEDERIGSDTVDRRIGL